MKGVKVIFVLVLLITFSVSLGSVETGNDFELMLQKAYKYGTIRVILNLDIPDIDKLTAESSRIKTGDTSSMARQAGFDADLKLEKGISAVSDKILHKLNNYTYRIVRRYSTLPFLALSVSPEAFLQIRSIGEVNSVWEDKLIPLPE
ncbi:MAG: hypothetical protein KAR14_14005, partial [Candidatus Aminicenantes bacterium]|nr:hypothetical protein [Candidatus Aminicenantes bacterium]